MTGKHLKHLAAMSAFALWAGQAQAAVFAVNLTGVVSGSNYFSFDSGGTHYDQWSLSLSGLDPSNEITVAQDDVINATVTLDQPFTIPASVTLTSFDLTLGGSAFPAVNTGTDGSTAFFNGVVPGPAGAAGTTTSSQLVNSVIFFPPDNGAITFDSVTSNFTITDLSEPATLNYAILTYTLFSPSAAPVPEPATWAMMIAGFGLVGGALRRRNMATRVTYA